MQIPTELESRLAAMEAQIRSLTTQRSPDQVRQNIRIPNDSLQLRTSVRFIEPVVILSGSGASSVPWFTWDATGYMADSASVAIVQCELYADGGGYTRAYTREPIQSWEYLMAGCLDTAATEDYHACVSFAPVIRNGGVSGIDFKVDSGGTNSTWDLKLIGYIA